MDVIIEMDEGFDVDNAERAAQATVFVYNAELATDDANRCLGTVKAKFREGPDADQYQIATELPNMT